MTLSVTLDCTESIASYHGTISTTASGLQCARWDSRLYPKKTLTEAENYCRAINIEAKGSPWCYIANWEENWQYCDIPFCPLTGNSTVEAEQKDSPLTH